MSDRDIRTGVAFEVDKQSQKKALAAIDKVQRGLQESNKQLDTSAAKRYGRELEKSFDGGVSAVRQANSALDEQNSLMLRNARTIDDYNARFNKLSQDVGLAGDVQSNLGAISGLASAAGAGGLGEGVAVGGELFALLEEAPRLKTALGGIPQVASAATDALGLGGVTGGLQKAIPALGAGGAALATLGGVGLAAGAALAVVNTELERQRLAAERAAAAAREAIELRRTEREATLDAAELAERAAQGDVQAFQQLQSIRDDYTRQLRLEGETLADEQERRIRLQKDLESLTGDIEGNSLIEKLNRAGVGLTDFFGGGRISEVGAELEAQEAAVNSASAAIKTLTTESTEYTRALLSIPPAQREALQAQVDATSESARNLEKVGNEYETISGRIASLTQQASDIVERNATQASRQAAIAALQAQKARQQDVFQEADHQQRLLDIEKKGNADIEAARDKLAALPAQLTDALDTASDKAADKLEALESDYFATQIKATQDFRKRQARVNEDYAREVERTLDDIERSLQDAARDNNVLAFLEAQRSGDTRLSRMSEDQSVSQQRAIQDFRDESAARRQAFQERRQQIDQTLQAEKAAIQEKFAVERAEIQEAIEARQKQLDNELQSVQAAYDQRERRRAALAEIDQRIDAQREQFAQADLNRTLRNIRIKAEAENAALRDVLALRRQIARESGQATLGTPSGSSVPSGVNTSFGTGSGLQPSISAGLEAGSGGRGTPVFNVSVAQNNTVGDIATQSQLQQANRDMAMQVGETLVQVLQNAVYPNG